MDALCLKTTTLLLDLIDIARQPLPHGLVGPRHHYQRPNRACDDAAA